MTKVIFTKKKMIDFNTKMHAKRMYVYFVLLLSFNEQYCFIMFGIFEYNNLITQ